MTYKNTKKAVGGLFGLLGSFFAPLVTACFFVILSCQLFILLQVPTMREMNNHSTLTHSLFHCKSPSKFSNSCDIMS